MPHHYNEYEAAITGDGTAITALFGRSEAQDAYDLARAQDVTKRLEVFLNSLTQETQGNAQESEQWRDRHAIYREELEVQKAAGIRDDQIAANHLLQDSQQHIDNLALARERIFADIETVNARIRAEEQQLTRELGFRAAESYAGRALQAAQDRLNRVTHAISFIEEDQQFRTSERRRIAEQVGNILRDPSDVGAVGGVLETLQPGSLSTAIGSGEDLRSDLSLSPLAANLAALDQLGQMNPRTAMLLEQLMKPIEVIGPTFADGQQQAHVQAAAPRATDPVETVDAPVVAEVEAGADPTLYQQEVGDAGLFTYNGITLDPNTGQVVNDVNQAPDPTPGLFTYNGITLDPNTGQVIYPAGAANAQVALDTSNDPTLYQDPAGAANAQVALDTSNDPTNSGIPPTVTLSPAERERQRRRAAEQKRRAQTGAPGFG